VSKSSLIDNRSLDVDELFRSSSDAHVDWYNNCYLQMQRTYIIFSGMTMISLNMLIIMQSLVIIMWDANHEHDLAGYRIYYGNSSRSYNEVVHVGLDTIYTFCDLKSGKTYYFAVTAYDTVGNESNYSNETVLFLPADTLENSSIYNNQHNDKSYNYPNPFNPTQQKTHIRYYLNEAQKIMIRIYDTNGDNVCSIIDNEHKMAGEHIEDMWDGMNDQGKLVQNGVYFAIIKKATGQDIIPITVIK
jgi:hypothetical protein